MASPDPASWPPGVGEMVDRIRGFDWAETSLGPIAGWSPALRNTVEVMLACAFPMALRHGPGRTLVYNDGYARLLGDHHPAMLGRPSKSAIQEIGDRFEPEYQRALAGETVRLDHLHCPLQRGGKVVDAWFDSTVMPWRETDGRIAGCLTLANEITAQVQAEHEAEHVGEQLREGESRFRMLFDAIDEGFCIIEMIYDADGRPCDYRFELTNASFTRQTGMEDAVGRTIREFAPEHEQFWYDRYGQIADDGVAQRFEMRAEALGRWYDVYAFRIGAPEERRLGVLFNDVSVRLQSEAALRASEAQLSALVEQLAEADRRKNEFLATLAHELRNPLAPLTTAAYLLGLDGGDPDGSLRTMIQRQVQHMVRLVDDLLDISRISRGQITLQKGPLDLVGVVASVAETSGALIDSHGHDLELRLSPEPVPVEGDETRLSQVIANLLNNAAKYTPHGGRVLLTVDRVDGEAVVVVEDSGIGLPPEALEVVFGMFAQLPDARGRAQGGLGIGLALARRMAELHGGTLHAESEGSGQGSRFVLRLPLMATVAQPAPSLAMPVSTPSATARRVLVVDDNHDAADSLADLLRILGHEVRVGYDGPTGLMLAEEFRPHLGLLDIGMPEMDGRALARAIREHDWGRAIRLAAVSGWGQHDDREQSRAAGFDDHVAKPIDVATLQRLLCAVANTEAPRRIA